MQIANVIQQADFFDSWSQHNVSDWLMKEAELLMDDRMIKTASTPADRQWISEPSQQNTGYWAPAAGYGTAAAGVAATPLIYTIRKDAMLRNIYKAIRSSGMQQSGHGIERYTLSIAKKYGKNWPHGILEELKILLARNPQNENLANNLTNYSKFIRENTNAIREIAESITPVEKGILTQLADGEIGAMEALKKSVNKGVRNMARDVTDPLGGIKRRTISPLRSGIQKRKNKQIEKGIAGRAKAREIARSTIDRRTQTLENAHNIQSQGVDEAVRAGEEAAKKIKPGQSYITPGASSRAAWDRSVSLPGATPSGSVGASPATGATPLSPQPRTSLITQSKKNLQQHLEDSFELLKQNIKNATQSQNFKGLIKNILKNWINGIKTSISNGTIYAKIGKGAMHIGASILLGWVGEHLQRMAYTKPLEMQKENGWDDMKTAVVQAALNGLVAGAGAGAAISGRPDLAFGAAIGWMENIKQDYQKTKQVIQRALQSGQEAQKADAGIKALEQIKEIHKAMQPIYNELVSMQNQGATQQQKQRLYQEYYKMMRMVDDLRTQADLVSQKGMTQKGMIDWAKQRGINPQHTTQPQQPQQPLPKVNPLLLGLGMQKMPGQ